MVLLASLLGFGTIASANPLALLQRAACAGDNCARAVTGSLARPAASVRQSDCSSFLAKTVTPPTITSTVTTTNTPGASTVSTSVVTVYSTTVTVTSAAAVKKRATTISGSVYNSASSVPSYISTLCGTGTTSASRYSSACSCFGIVGTTIVVPAPTITVTNTVTAAQPFTTVTSTTTIASTTTVAPACGPSASAQFHATIFGGYADQQPVSGPSEYQVQTDNGWALTGRTADLYTLTPEGHVSVSGSDLYWSFNNEDPGEQDIAIYGTNAGGGFVPLICSISCTSGQLTCSGTSVNYDGSPQTRSYLFSCSNSPLIYIGDADEEAYTQGNASPGVDCAYLSIQTTPA